MESSNPIFYSALTQASATIVALIGAVLGSRVLDRATRLREEWQSVSDRVANVYQQLVGSRLNTIAQLIQEEIDRHDAAMRSGERQRDVTAELLWDMTRSVSRPIRVDISEHRADLQQKLDWARRLEPAYERFAGEITITSIGQGINGLQAFMHIAPDGLRFALERDIQNLTELRQSVSSLQARAVPGSFVLVLIVLLWLTVVGVLVPLLALQGPRWMKTTFALGLTGLVLIFAYQLMELRKLSKLYWP